jgi:hypothetical protein
MSLIFPVDAKLKAGLPVQLMLADEQDVEPLRSLTGSLSKKGDSYSHDRHARPLDLRAILSAIADRMVDKHWVFQ